MYPANIPSSRTPTRSIIACGACLILLILAQCLKGVPAFAAAPALAGDKSAITASEKTKEAFASTFGLYDLSTFDVTEQAGVIHLLIGGKKTADSKKPTLRYLRYNPHEQQWQIIATLDEKLPETIASRGNDIQIAAHNHLLLALWQTKGELPGIGPIVSAYSTDAGETWQQGANPAASAENDNAAYIDLTADEKGRFHAVWLADPQEKGHQSLYHSYTLDHGKSWQQPAILDDSTCACCWNKLIHTPDKRLFVLYRDSHPRDMALIQSSNSGVNWQRMGNVGQFEWEFNGCPHIGGGLSHNGEKNSHVLHAVVWTGHESLSGLYYLGSTDDGRSWTNPKILGETALNGDIAARGNNVAVIWNLMEEHGLSVYVATSDNAGLTWSQPRRLADETRVTVHPKIIATQTGFIALWTETPLGKTSQLAWHIIE